MGTYIVGDWRVDFDAGWLEPRRKMLRRRNYPDSRLVAVLRVLTLRAGELISNEEILSEAWPDRVVTRDSVTTAIYELRQILGDETASPTYIRTEPRRGYRFIGAVEQETTPRWMHSHRSAASFVIGLAILGAVLVTQIDQHPPKLQVGQLQDVSRDGQIAPLADAIDATLRSALIRMNPGRVTAAAGNGRTALRLQSEIVVCDLGPALVVQLLDLTENRYVWSRTYTLDYHGASPSLVELVANDVTAALSES